MHNQNKEKTMRNLEGQTVLVIGGTGDIGSILCQEFSKAKINVAVMARNQTRIDVMRGGLPSNILDNFLFDKGDAAIPGHVERALAQTFDKFGRLDAVIVSAGTHKSSGAEDWISGDFVDEMYRSIYLPTRVAAHVAQQFFRLNDTAGWIVNISSHAATKLLPGNLDYGPMKAAARHFMRLLDLELKKIESPIRVTDIQPAIVNTPKTREWIINQGQDPVGAVQPEDITHWIMEGLQTLEAPVEKEFAAQFIL
jgi:NAD(P)-dependent dehydrogenase (short-subunit alcohol dehydrogenase family)